MDIIGGIEFKIHDANIKSIIKVQSILSLF